MVDAARLARIEAFLERVFPTAVPELFPHRVPARAYANPVPFEQSGMDVKFREYTTPEVDGISDIGAEGRMFLEAVERGFVPATVEGLVTLLEWTGMGRVNQTGLTELGQAVENGDPILTPFWTWYKAGSDTKRWVA